MQEVKKQTSWYVIIMLSILILIQEIPYTSRVTGSWISVPFIALLMLPYLSTTIRMKQRNRAFYICVILYLAIQFGYKALRISSAPFGHDIHIVLFLFFFFAMRLTDGMNRRQKQFVLWITVIGIGVTVVTNIASYVRMGGSYFRIFRNTEELYTTNIASTQYFSAIMLLCGFLLICFLRDRNKYRRFMWLVLFIAMNLFGILIGQRALSLILSVVMYVLILVFNNKHKLYVNLLFIAGAVLLIIGLLNYDAVLSFLIGVFGKGRISSKLTLISKFLSSGEIQDVGGSLTARYNLYMRSLNTWTSSIPSFFFGVGDHIENNQIIGNHSQFLDVLGQYGLVGASLLYYCIYRILRELLNRLPVQRKTPMYRQAQVICLTFLVRGLLGGVLYEQIGVQMFIVFPVMLSLISKGAKRT